MLDYEYIKNHYRLIAVNLSRKKGLAKVTNSQSKKLKSVAKDKTGTTLITKKNFQDEELI